MTIGTLSRQSGVNIETIRYYERERLLGVPPRSSGGHRRFERGDLARLTFIRRARELGFSLDEVRRLLAIAEGSSRSCSDVSSVAAAHLDEVRRKMADLRRLERVPASLVASCNRGRVPRCPILETLSAPDEPASDSAVVQPWRGHAARADKQGRMICRRR